jgi:methylenetetrahydrofolate reductase (NADPH)
MTAGHLESALRAGRFVITAEITPPLSFAREDLLAKALPFKDIADALNVTDGAGARATMGPVTAAGILKESGIEPILQLTCRDRNRLALQSELIAAATLGIRNLLLLRGDDPSAGDQPETKGVFDLDSRALLQTAARMRDEGELPTGRKIGGKADFFIGAADMPVDPAPVWEPKGLKDKISAGARFAQTQFCMDAGVLRRYVQRLKEAGVPRDFYLLVGIAPLRSARSARWIREHLFGSIIPDALIARLDTANDPAEEGRRVCLELMQEFAEIPGVAGVHVMAPGHDADVPAVVAEARRLVKSSRPAAAE